MLQSTTDISTLQNSQKEKEKGAYGTHLPFHIVFLQF